ncbi:phage tail protein [Chitinibacteraceae bacterium HSL-7]
MARSGRKVLQLDAGAAQLAAASLRLQGMPDALRGAGIRAVNAVLPELLPEAREQIGATVRLRDGYVRERTTLVLAAQSSGGIGYLIARERATRLTTYQSRQVTTAAPKARGDRLRGIARGQKQAGVAVAVLRDEAPSAGAGRWFLVPLKRGRVARGNGFGVFERTGRGRNAIRHLYGPSVATVFRWVLPEVTEVANRMLADALHAELKQLGSS